MIVVFMAVLVFYGGAGINIISYCCKECRSAGIEALINNKCCDIHNHNHENEHNRKHTLSASCCNHIVYVKDNYSESNHSTHAENSCCNSEHSDLNNSNCDNPYDENCNMERANFDWNSQNFTELKIDLSPNEYELFSNNLFNNSPAHLLQISENNAAMPNGPPLVSPRDYLSVLTVLLI